MAGGIAIQQFLDWAINTGPIFLSGEDRIVNNISKRSFLLGKMLRGKPASQTIQGGNKIQETLYLLANRTFTTFKRNTDVTWENPQKDTLVQYDWRFTLDHMTWDEAEYELQTSGLSGIGLKTKYKDMAFSKMQRVWESMIDGWEDLLWQAPNGADQFAEMEGANGQEPYSIPVFVNESGSATQGFDSNWTTIGQVSMATYGQNWDNARVQYDANDPGDTDGNQNGLLNAFDDISVTINYRPPGFKDEYFEKASEVGNRHIICTSKKGLTQIMGIYRSSNDNLIQPQDGSYPMPRWNGMALYDIAALDTAALYDDGSSGFVSEEAATVTNSGARYYFLNTEYLNVVYHSAKYFKMKDTPKEPERKVGVYVVPVECWGNMTCTSRRHQGIVYPGA